MASVAAKARIQWRAPVGQGARIFGSIAIGISVLRSDHTQPAPRIHLLFFLEQSSSKLQSHFGGARLSPVPSRSVSVSPSCRLNNWVLLRLGTAALLAKMRLAAIAPHGFNVFVEISEIRVNPPVCFPVFRFQFSFRFPRSSRVAHASSRVSSRVRPSKDLDSIGGSRVHGSRDSQAPPPQ